MFTENQLDLRPLVLCCDDEPELCAFLAEEMAEAGFRTMQANSGQQALDLLSETSFDAVVTDIQMPDGDGIQLLKGIRNSSFNRPLVIFLTGSTTFSDIEAYDEGAEAIFLKPVDYRHLASRVHELLKPPSERFQSEVESLDEKKPLKLKLDSVENLNQDKQFNLGRGGFFMSCGEDLPNVNEVRRFAIEVKDATFSPITGAAVCRWRRLEDRSDGPQGAGFEFCSLDVSTMEHLDKLILQIKPKSFIPKA